MSGRGDSTVERQHARLIKLNDENARLRERLAAVTEENKALRKQEAAQEVRTRQMRNAYSAAQSRYNRAVEREQKKDAKLERAEKLLAEIHALSK